jgi:hypothetical protein
MLVGIGSEELVDLIRVERFEVIVKRRSCRWVVDPQELAQLTVFDPARR